MRTLLITLAASLTALSQAAVELSDNLPPTPADYLTDALLATDGSIWITSEGKGVYRLDPSADDKRDTTAWFDASYFQGLPDTVNYYAIAEDKQGRIWAGTDNKGVAVFNGESWKVYDRENALLGERVFDIAVCPATGHVAVATSGGLNIYLPDTGQWLDLTRADGLVEDQIQSLCYDGRGNLWAAYQCGGVSRLSQRDNYKNTQTDQAPWYWDKENRVRQPLDGAGKGLPSNLCNAIHASPGGTVLVGTNSGLAWQTPGNNGWNYLRGKDYEAKNKGLWDVKVEPSSIRKPSLPLLSEDYITDIAETKEGYWIGYRQQGASLVDRNMKQIREGKFPDRMKTKYVTSLLTLPGGGVYAATYGHGLVKISDGSNRNRLPVVQQPSHPKHPSEAAIKSMEELTSILTTTNDNQAAGQGAFYWRDDWATQGDWCDRYGMDYGLLCGTFNMSNDTFRSPWTEIKISYTAGPHQLGDKGLFARPHNDRASTNINVPFNPKTGTRFAAEWTDNGEDCPPNFDGPDIWTRIHIPDGRYFIALYLFNYQGHELNLGPVRDYLIELRAGKEGEIEEQRVDIKTPIFARARVKDFSQNGVYKTFVVQGPANYDLRIINNYSSDTILNGIFVSDVKYFNESVSQTIQKTGILQWSKIPNLQKTLLTDTSKNLRFYRFAAQKKQGEQLRKSLNLWTKLEHNQAEKTMLKKWYQLQDEYTTYRSQEFFPFSPRTIPFTARECDAMEYLGIDWKEYLPDNPEKPAISAIELKDKISLISEVELEQLKNEYDRRKIDEIKNTIKKQ